jgi:hypothetical protein
VDVLVIPPEQVQQHLILDFNPEKDVLNPFEGSVAFLFLQVPVDFGHCCLDAFEDVVHFLHLDVSTNDFPCFDVPVLRFDFDLGGK